MIGDYSYSLLVFGSEDTVVANANDSVKKLQDAGFLPIKSTLALVTSYLHQLPGRKDRPRVAKISSMNLLISPVFIISRVENATGTLGAKLSR